MSATVAEEWKMRCPQCGCDEAIEIAAIVYCRLRPEGSEANGDHEWENDSTAYCVQCGFKGTVADFENAEEGGADDV